MAKDTGSKTLYRAYRPSDWGEVRGQPQVTDVLEKALKNKKIAQAYLFCGTRGTGKTTVARILAKKLGVNDADLYEIDAASNTGVDNIRELRESVQTMPFQSPYKFYIIDEAHQLGPGAANALLKVVEEPPPHVLFIFATTEPDKLISTIRSRTHHYPFRLVPPGILTAHLESICKQEDVKVAKGVLPLVVRAGGGSVRDSLSILGQLLAGAGSDTGRRTGRIGRALRMGPGRGDRRLAESVHDSARPGFYVREPQGMEVRRERQPAALLFQPQEGKEKRGRRRIQ